MAGDDCGQIGASSVRVRHVKRILAAVAVLALLGAWFVSRPTDDASAPLESAIAASPVEATTVSSQPEAPFRSSGRSEVQLQGPAILEMASPSRTSFHYADGTPAAGLAYYVRWPTISITGIVAKKPEWLGHLSDTGELPGDEWMPYDWLCFRLSAESVQTVKQDGEPRHELARPSTQTIRLVAPRADCWSELEIRNRAVDRLYNATVLAESSEGTLADDFVLTGQHEEDLVVARARVRVTPTEPAHFEVPQGTYWIALKSCTFGFDFDGVEAVLDGRPFTIALHPVPLTQVMLPLDKSGKPVQPFTVRVVERTVDPTQAESAAEIDVPYEIRDEVMFVAQSYRPTRGTEYTTYALSITWWNGLRTTTPFGPWEKLLEDVTPEPR